MIGLKRRKETLYFRVDPENPDSDVIKAAAQVIKNGGTVAFPTETVYGLGANALDPEAVKKIFLIKGRPPGNPLIAHVSSFFQTYSLVRDWTDKAELLARRFWPGPLTLILKRSPLVPDEMTAGLPTVALRMPASDIALALITASGVPVAAPSANISGRPSPTRAEHVWADLAGKVDFILDGGPAKVGLESTILDLTGDVPVLLRPGSITKEELEGILGVEIIVHPAVLRGISGSDVNSMTAPSPGMLFRHYAPKARVIMVTGSPSEQVKKIASYLREHCDQRIGIIGTEENIPLYGEEFSAAYLKVLGSRKRPEDIARRFFDALRTFDEEGVDVILAETIPGEGIGLAVMNRLCRASENRCL